MAIWSCYICEKSPGEAARLRADRFEGGKICPVCFLPVCSQHLTTVRWRWKQEGGGHDSDQVCRECRKSYRHRSWDPIHRDWIT
jgi:hypothetical protein